MPADEAVATAEERTGLDIRVPTVQIASGLTLSAVELMDVPSGIQAPQAVTLYYSFPTGGDGQPATLEVEQFADAPAVRPGNPAEWEVTTAAYGSMTADIYTHLRDLRVTIIAVRGEGPEGFNVTVPSEHADTGMAFAEALSAAY